MVDKNNIARKEKCKSYIAIKFLKNKFIKRTIPQAFIAAGI